MAPWLARTASPPLWRRWRWWWLGLSPHALHGPSDGFAAMLMHGPCGQGCRWSGVDSEFSWRIACGPAGNTVCRYTGGAACRAREIGMRLATGIADVADNVAHDILSGRLADFAERATGMPPSHFSGPPSTGCVDSTLDTAWWGRYKRNVAKDMPGVGLPQRSTMYSPGASARQVGSVDRTRHLVFNTHTRSQAVAPGPLPPADGLSLVTDAVPPAPRLAVRRMGT